MATPLTNVREPGFFSAISVSPSLFLTPGSAQVIGLIGTGKATATVLSSGARGTDKSDAMPNPIKSITIASSDAVYMYPQSSYSIAQLGSIDLTTITLGDLNTKVLSAQIDGETADTVTFTTPATVADIATQINAAWTLIKAEITTANKLLLYVAGTGMDGKSFLIGSGNADTIVGLVSASRAQSVRWDPALTDANLAPQAGTVYTVNFERPKVAADFAPQSFFGLSQVVSMYGDVSAANTISLGAQGAFGNGASLVTCRQLDPDQMDTSSHIEGEMVSALEDMESQSLKIVVPMYPINTDPTALGLKYLDHVSKMSSLLERQERICILGTDEISGRMTTAGTGTTWHDLMAQFDVSESSGLSPERVMVVNPGYCQLNYKGTEIDADGTYIAACLAGRMVNANYDVAEPMTRKPLTTIDQLILPELARSEKNALTSYGVTVVEAVNNVIQVRRSITCDSSSIPAQEPSIVRSFDYVVENLRGALENRFVGTKILPTVTGTALVAATSHFMDTYVADEIIGAYRNVTAVQNSVEPRQFDIECEAAPIYPFLWGFLSLSVTLS